MFADLFCVQGWIVCAGAVFCRHVYVIDPISFCFNVNADGCFPIHDNCLLTFIDLFCFVNLFAFDVIVI